MNRTTGIEWTDHTWNPVIGCSVKSDGCKNCYAMALAGRIEAWGNKHYQGLTRNGKWTGKVVRNSEAVFLKPTRIARPSVIFVNSMSDFFHREVSNNLRIEILEVIQDCKRHQFQILTKRPENIGRFLKEVNLKYFPDNLWLGATVEDNRVKARVADIVKSPAKIKFISVEPLIASADQVNIDGLDWVITGGESGPRARVMKHQWLLDVADKCQKFSIRHFFKQYGKARNNPLFWEIVDGRHIPRANATSYVKEHDSIGKGGSKINGQYVKEMPKSFKVSDSYPRDNKSILLL